MYVPEAFREDEPATLHALIRSHPLATLITGGPAGLLANRVPFTLAEADDGPVLRAHIAKGNDQVEPLRCGCETLLLFDGPEAYITPSWYASKHEHGRVVPTWNYVTVQVRGTPTLIDDAAWLMAQISELTALQEGSREPAWKVIDAPEAFVAGQLKAIIGVEIRVTAMAGKWKVSQNRPEADQLGVERGLQTEGVSAEMAALIRERRKREM